MKAKIVREPLIDCISIIPDNEEELKVLHKLWKDGNIQFKKGGCCLHGDRKTHHSIVNSDFVVLLRNKDGERIKK